MTYSPPKVLAEQFSISLKTVYNYIKKHPTKIRTKKEFWKTFVNREDFTRILQRGFTAYNSVSNEWAKTPVSERLWIKNEPILKLEKEFNLALQKTEDLEKYNGNLQNQVSKYAMLLKEEKEEKKEWQTKYDILNTTHFETIENFSKERLGRSKKFFIILGISIALAVWLFFVLLPSITKFLQNL